MSFCTICSKQNDDTANFCTGCGSNLQTGMQEETTYHSNKKSKWIVRGSFAILLLSAGIYFIFIHKTKTNDSSASNGADTATVSELIVQPYIAKTSYNLPAEISYLPNLKTEAKSIEYYGPAFYPVGFSKDGMFSWAEGENPGESNDFAFTIYIQNLETDKIMWKWSADVIYETDEMDQEAFNKKCFKNIWNKNNALLTAKLNEHKIEPLVFGQLQKLPINLNGTTINFLLQNKWYMENGYATEMEASKILMTANAVEKKTIFNKKYSKTNTGEYIGMEVLVNRYILGFLMSPLQKRVAILLFDDYVGWEAGHYPQIQIVGCDLTSGD